MTDGVEDVRMERVGEENEGKDKVEINLDRP
jgi:hypothetical protein